MKFEIDGLDEFITAIDQAADGGLQDELESWLEAMGMEFLDLIQDEIIRTKTVDTRRLLNSFEKGDRENHWSITSGGLTLDVGTNVDYASYANDGHFAVDINSGKDRRWIPGYWSGERFVYMPGHDEGMLLGQQWIDGTGYWDSALAIFDRLFEKGLDRLLQQWIDDTF